MTPATVQIGEKYFAVIKSADGEEDILEKDGKNQPFDSAYKAMSAAMKAIAERSPKPSAQSIEVKPGKPEMVERWNAERLARLEADRQMRTLMGVTVVTLKRRRPMMGG